MNNILTVKSNKIDLPAELVKHLIGQEIEIIKIRDGILLRPVKNTIKIARGFLKGKGKFSTEKFMSQKQKEKELE